MARDLTPIMVTAALIGHAVCASAEFSELEQAEPGIAQLVAQLNHADFSVREKAETALVARGSSAVDELRQLYGDTSPEVRFRVRRVVLRIESVQFAGRWQLIRWESAGKANEGLENIIEIQGLAWHAENDVYSYSLNPLASPAEIDWHVGGRTWRGIYRLEGDLMILALREPGEDRPAGFVTTPADRTKLHTRRRLAEQ